jgi:hypothetical protein
MGPGTSVKRHSLPERSLRTMPASQAREMDTSPPRGLADMFRDIFQSNHLVAQFASTLLRS